MGDERRPTEPGFYWARWSERCPSNRKDTPGEFVVEYAPRPDYLDADEPDDPQPVATSGSDIPWTVEDFEWLEGPLKRSAPQ